MGWILPICNEDFSHSLFFLFCIVERGVNLQTLLEFELKNKQGGDNQIISWGILQFQGAHVLALQRVFDPISSVFQLAIGRAKNWLIPRFLYYRPFP